jgi:Nuclear transport factor 2 (NTF2) domain
MKQEEPKKFVQTFVLAQQPSGYFVLNDILRYINEDGDDEADETVEKADEVEPEAPVESEVEEEVELVNEEEPDEPATAGVLDSTEVDKKLEEISDDKEIPSNGAVDSLPDSTKEEPDVAAESGTDPDIAERQLAEEDIKIPEKPQEPSPTPIAPTTTPAAVEPEKPVPAAAPPKPMTWASRAAAAAGPPRPVVPLPKTGTPPAPSQARAPAQPAPATASVATPQAAEPTAKENTAPGSEWQMAGAESKRQNRPQSVSGAPAEKEGTMAYIKYVTEKVKTDDLRATLTNFGELTYFDINRQKVSLSPSLV